MSINKNILKTLELSDDLFVEINNLKYLPYELLWGTNLQGYSKKSVQTVLGSVVKKGYVKKAIRKEKVYLALTDLGKAFLDKKRNRYSLKLSPSGRRWDGLYRFIFFDIPEKDRIVRDTLRQALKEIGGVGWQKSVWVTKENITRELNIFIQEHALEDYLLVVEVKDLYNPRLRKILDSN